MVVDGDVDLVEDDDVVFAGFDDGFCVVEALVGEVDVDLLWFLFVDELVAAELCDGEARDFF